MLTVTEPAAAQLDAMLSQAPEGAAIRLVANGQMLEPRVDQPREGDQTYKHGEKVVLLVEPAMVEALTDRVLDAQMTEQGAQLSLKQVPPDTPEPASAAN